MKSHTILLLLAAFATVALLAPPSARAVSQEETLAASQEETPAASQDDERDEEGEAPRRPSTAPT